MPKKKDGRSINRETLEYLRKRGIMLWKEGRDVKDIAHDFGVTIFAVYQWIRNYKQKGLKGLKRTRAPGAKPKLAKKEKRKLLTMLKKTADQYGFITPLWDTKKVKQLIWKKFRKKIDHSNVWRLMRRENLTPQKPEKIAYEQDKEKVEEWINKKWPRIKAHATRWQAMLYFLDECTVQLQPTVRKTWAIKGNTPKITLTGKRGSIALTSVISPAGRMSFKLEKEKERINAKKHIEFLKQLMKQHPNRKIIVIEDNAKAHIAKMVKEFTKEHKKRLAIYHLPPYSPKLNPDEHVWGYLKSVKLIAHQATTTAELSKKIRQGMRSIQMRLPLMMSFFYGPLFD